MLKLASNGNKNYEPKNKPQTLPFMSDLENTLKAKRFKITSLNDDSNESLIIGITNESNLSKKNSNSSNHIKTIQNKQENEKIFKKANINESQSTTNSNQSINLDYLNNNYCLFSYIFIFK